MKSYYLASSREDRGAAREEGARKARRHERQEESGEGAVGLGGGCHRRGRIDCVAKASSIKTPSGKSTIAPVILVELYL